MIVLIKKRYIYGYLLLLIFYIGIFFPAIHAETLQEKSILQEIAIEAIRIYQRIPILKDGSCRFYPSCSNYAIQAIENYGFTIGCLMTFDRLQRCHPFAVFSVDLPEKHYIFALSNNRKGSINIPFSIHCRGGDIFCSDNVLEFAENLFAEKDYARAITEYKRFIYFNRDKVNPNINFAYFRIGECYYYLGKTDPALRTFRNLLQNLDNRDELKSRTFFIMGKIYYREGQFFLSRSMFKDIVQNYPTAPLSPTAQLYIGMTYLQEKRWRESSEEFSKVKDLFPSSSTVEFSERISKEVLSGEKLPKKSTLKAGILSIIPGLGKIYAGKTKDGLFSFFTISLLGYLAYDSYNRNLQLLGSILGLAFLSYYLGNIYGGIDAARLYNIQQDEKFIKKIQTEFDRFYEEENN